MASSLRSVLLAYFQLMRLPAVFSAMADIFLGWLLVHRAPATLEPWPRLAALLAASCGLYLAGMVFNDVFDREVDARERPGRPIPSGRIKLSTAITLGTLLAVGGLGAAAAAGMTSLIVAGLLVLCIFAYDGLLKSTVVGPIVMGSCRFLNVLLGTSAIDSFPEMLSTGPLLAAGGLGVYIVGVTWFARNEAGESTPGQLAGAIGVINLGFAILILFLFLVGGVVRMSPAMMSLGFAIIAAQINVRLMQVYATPTPRMVQGGVRLLLYTLVVLDGMLVLYVSDSALLGLMVIALLVPALLLGRWMSVT